MAAYGEHLQAKAEREAQEKADRDNEKAEREAQQPVSSEALVGGDPKNEFKEGMEVLTSSKRSKDKWDNKVGTIVCFKGKDNSKAMVKLPDGNVHQFELQNLKVPKLAVPAGSFPPKRKATDADDNSTSGKKPAITPSPTASRLFDEKDVPDM